MPATLVVIVTVIFPGTGHLVLRRYLKGSVLAALFAASADVFLITAFLWPGEGKAELIAVSLGIAVLVWGYALFDVVRQVRKLRAEDFQERKDTLLKSAQVAWLRDECVEAERLLREIIRLDDRDVAAWVHLGKVLKSCSREEESRQCFRTALNLEGSDLWRWELRRELGKTEVEADEAEPS